MRRQSFLAGLVLILDLTLFGAAGRADLYCEEPVHQAGQVHNGVPLNHQFTIVNRGSAPVEIVDVRSTCGCLTPQLEKRTLQPGERSRLLLEVNTLALAEGNQSWHTRLLYRDGANTNELDLVVVGDVVTEVLVQPSALTLPADAPGVHEITVADRRAHSLTIRATEGGGNCLRAIVGTAQRAGGTSVQRVRLEVAADCPEGRHDLALHLYTDDPVYRVFAVPVTIVKRPRGLVSATPGQVTFESEKGDAIPPRLVRLGAAGAAIEIDHIAADNAAVSCTWESGPDSLMTVKIRVDPTRLAGDLQTTVHVHLRKPAEETVTIPVLCVVR